MKTKFAFEKYEFNNRGRIFKGYQTVEAFSLEEAKELAQAKAGEEITLVQIYLPQY